MKKSEKKKLRRAERRKLELERRKKRVKTAMATSVLLIAVICVGAYYVLSISGNDNVQDTGTQLPPSQTQTEVRIPLSEISSNAKFYTYDADDVEIKYFSVLGSDGDIHVAVDACDICYHAKKGYRQNGEVMHCINCGLEFPINDIGTENTAGGCWPSYLPISIEGDDVVIKISDLQEKIYMFA